MKIRKIWGAVATMSLVAPLGLTVAGSVSAAPLSPNARVLVRGTAGANPNASIDDFVVSSDGVWAAFSSAADNLVTGDSNGVTDVFVMKMSSGAIKRVSVGADGSEFSEDSTKPSICGNGQIVTFQTSQDVDTQNDYNFGQDVYAVNRDADGNGRFDEYSRTIGVTVSLVSVGSIGVSTSDGAQDGVVSADCQWVAYDTTDSLEDADANGISDVYVHSLASSDTTYDSSGLIVSTRNVLISDGLKSSDGGGGYLPTLSEDGSLVAFYSRGLDLVSSTGTRGGAILYNRDADADGIFDELGAGATSREYVSKNDAGAASAGDPDDSAPMSMTPDGSCIAFRFSTGNDLDTESGITASNGVYLRDRVHNTTRIMSYANSGGLALATNDAANPEVSDDCLFVTFDSGDDTLMAEDSNSKRDVFLHDVENGTTFLISRTADGATAAGTSLSAHVDTASVDGTVPVIVVSDAASIAGASSSGAFARPFVVKYNVKFPNSPRNLVANVVAGAPAKVALSWKAPMGSESLEFAGYVASFRCGSKGATAPCNGLWNNVGYAQVDDPDFHTSTSTFVQNLTLPYGTGGKTVTVALRAVLNDDQSSTGPAATTTVTPIDLNAPQSFSASVVTGQQRKVLLSYDAPADSSSFDIFGYSVSFRCGTGAGTAPCNNKLTSIGLVPGNKTVALPEGTAGSTVTLSLKAVLNDANGPSGPEVTTTVTPIDLPTLAAAPLTLTAGSAATTTKPITVRIISAPVIALNGASITSYSVEYSSNATTWTSVSAPTGGWVPGATKTVTGLKSKTKYSVRLTVVTNAGSVTKVQTITTK